MRAVDGHLSSAGIAGPSSDTHAGRGRAQHQLDLAVGLKHSAPARRSDVHDPDCAATSALWLAARVLIDTMGIRSRGV